MYRSTRRRTNHERATLRRHVASGADASSRARVVAFGLSIVLLLLTTACGEQPVANVPTESEAIEIIDVLRESGFEAEKREVGEGETKKWSVVLDEGYFGEGNLGLAIQVLQDHGLPRPEEPPVESGGFVPSEMEQRLQEQRRVRTEIERQLRALPGVTSAIVTVVLPPPDQVYRIQPQPATASALVIYKDANARFSEQVVQNMVAKSVPDLKPENVSVTMSQQTPRPVPHRELNARRRGNLLLAAGTGLVVVLSFLLIVLLLQTRRQRAEIADLREAHDEASQDDEEDDDDVANELPPAGSRAGDGSIGKGASAPALPPASSQR